MVLVSVVLAFLATATLLADGTLLGTIAGRVVDEDGNALPGATVEIISADQGFQRFLTSDATGSFTFALLQPGPYVVRVSLPSFQSFEARDNVVTPDKTTLITVTLKIAAATATITVTGETPLVDKTNTSATTHVTSTLTQKLAVSRDSWDLIALAPGVSSSGFNPNVHGALASNNLYLLDGVDTTDAATGTFNELINYEAIQEVAVSTAGISAEYGRAQGAYVNVITKSGTNQLHGSFKLLMTNDDWNAQTKGENPIPNLDGSHDSFARSKFDKTIVHDAYTLGGPIWRDHIWFFGAYETVDSTSPQRQTFKSNIYPDSTGQNYQETVDVRIWDGKLSGQITPSQLLVAQFNSDPIKGFAVDYWGGSANLEALTRQDQNQCSGLGCLKQLHWSGVFGSHVGAEAGYANQASNISVGPFVGHGSPYFSIADGLYYNGATFVGFVETPRKQANAAISIYHELFGRTAQLKVGLDYQSLESAASFSYPNNETFIVNQFDPSLGQNQNFAVGDEWDRFTAPRPSISRGKIWGYYALEKFEARRVTFNLGARIDHQTARSDVGFTVLNSTKVSPRLSAAWDLSGDGKMLISAGFGRYYQFLIQAIADFVFAGVPQQKNRDINLWDGSQWVLDRSVRVNGSTQPVNDDLSPSYADELNLAVQRRIGSSIAVGIRGIYRKWNDLIDDVKMFDETGNEILTPRNFPSDVARRSYKGIELTFEKRFTGNWQALANYTLSRTSGNQFADYTSQLFDFPGEECEVTGVGSLPCGQATDLNQFGIAPYDRTHVLNVLAAYTVSLPSVNLTAGPVFRWQSGLPYERQRHLGVPDGSPGNFYFIDRRGSSRLPSWYQIDFALEGTFKPFGVGPHWLVGGPIELGVKAEVFNVTNQQTIVNTRFISTLPNEFFGKPTSRDALQAPRSFRFTGLVRF